MPINMNDDIFQEKLLNAFGVQKNTPLGSSSKNAGINYANKINSQAQSRLSDFRQAMRVMDQIQAINRFKWHAVPEGIRGSIIERILYYRNNGMFWEDKTLNKFAFHPYSLASEGEEQIDWYGQFIKVRPYTFNGKAEQEEKSNKKKSPIDIYLGSITREPVYDEETAKILVKEHGLKWCQENLCVIIRDYTQQISEQPLPRSILQGVFINSQSEIPLWFRTSLIKALRPDLVRTQQGQLDVALLEFRTIENSTLNGETLLPVETFQELQSLQSSGSDRLTETILRSYDAMDTIRRAHLGITTNGAFTKESGQSETEIESKSDKVNLILEDALNNRQEACNIIRIIWPELKIYVDEGAGIDERHENKAENKEAKEMEAVDNGNGSEEISD